MSESGIIANAQLDRPVSESEPTDVELQRMNEQMTQTDWLDGAPAKLVHLSNAKGMTASFMDIGATWLSARVPVAGKPREVLLRANDIQSHLEQTAYLGAIVGRVGNRIAKGQFELNGQQYLLPINNGENSLHGGEVGFDKQRWHIKAQGSQSVTFSLLSVDGDQGYPGNMQVEVEYRLTDDNQVVIRYFATTDKDCPINLTNHAYFNLGGEGSGWSAKDHGLQMCAQYYLPTNTQLIPTGELKATQGTSFDFSQMKKIGADFLTDDDQDIASGYDHAVVFEPERCDGKQVVAQLMSPNDDLLMQVFTTKPAMQFYSGNFLAGTNGASKPYPNYYGVALETQFLPDAPNHPEWVDLNLGESILKVGKTYQHQTSYKFISA